jgi:hypothetical protein
LTGEREAFCGANTPLTLFTPLKNVKDVFIYHRLPHRLVSAVAALMNTVKTKKRRKKKAAVQSAYNKPLQGSNKIYREQT